MTRSQETIAPVDSLPAGWSLRIVDRGTKDRWLVLRGPDGQEAAFGCERGEYASPRSKVLDQFMAAASSPQCEQTQAMGRAQVRCRRKATRIVRNGTKACGVCAGVMKRQGLGDSRPLTDEEQARG